MSSAAATSLISTPDRLLSFTAVALNRSPYLATLRAPALATTHLQAVSPRCQLIRGKLGVRVDWAVRRPSHLQVVALIAAGSCSRSRELMRNVRSPRTAIPLCLSHQTE